MRHSTLPWVGIAVAALLVSCTESVTTLPQDIHLADEWLEFGTVDAGSPQTLTTRIHNAGDGDLTFSELPTVVADFGGSYTIDADWTSIPAREHRDLAVTYTPGESAYAYAHVAFSSDDPDEPFRFLVLTGATTVEAPAATVSPSLVDFGFVPAGGSTSRNVEVTNLGNTTIRVTGVELGGSTDRFEVTDWPDHDLPPGGSGLITAAFTSEGGEHTLGSLAVEIDGAPHGEYAVQLTGNTPGSEGNSAPHVGLISPDRPLIYYAHQDLIVEAEAFDVQQPDTGLYCTLDSTIMGAVEQDASDPVTQHLTMIVDVYNEDISDFQLVDYPGIHSMTLCCFDEFAASDCVGFVASVEVPFSDDDGDGDGYDAAQGDCDEDDADVYPGALERANGIDDDCDGDTDEDTEVSDDDGDGFSESDGDCDDDDPAVHPDADEQPNYLDDDCDGSLDEGTVNVDDDGDGISEALGDCDDTDAGIFPDAPEPCDGLDNDCDGSIDDDCTDSVPPLALVGEVMATPSRVTPGEAVRVTLIVVGPDADLRYDWQSDGGTFEVEGDPELAAEVLWIAPEETGTYGIFCEVTDVNTEQDVTGFVEVEVTRSDPTASTSTGSGCEVGRHSAGALLPLLALASLVAVGSCRRRATTGRTPRTP